mmetsp:Transcript_113421/g.218354  ORF Transcript_113421/g.218354 Transcript_113421/m.218354 type:complete len:262 (-) Transcript_113421:313-1098(-)
MSFASARSIAPSSVVAAVLLLGSLLQELASKPSDHFPQRCRESAAKQRTAPNPCAASRLSTRRTFASERSTAKRPSPPLPSSCARCVVLPPGAAHMSRTRSPGRGASIRAAAPDGNCCNNKRPCNAVSERMSLSGARGSVLQRRQQTRTATPLEGNAKTSARSMAASPLATSTAGNAAGAAGPEPRIVPRVGTRCPTGITQSRTACPLDTAAEVAITPAQKTSAPLRTAIAHAASITASAAPSAARTSAPVKPKKAGAELA